MPRSIDVILRGGIVD
jgi:DNA replication licensing factor MCM6